MNRLNIKIKISTRLLAYFLFVTVLPLSILSLSSTLLINSSLNDKLIQDLDKNSEYIWEIYDKAIADFKINLSNLPDDKLKKAIIRKNKKNINTELKNITEKGNVHLALLFDNNKDLISSNINNDAFRDIKVINHSTINLKGLINLAKRNNIAISSELININDLLKLGVLKDTSFHNTFNNKLGFYIQSGVIKFTISNENYYLFVGQVIDQNSKIFSQIRSSYGSLAILSQNNNILLTNSKENIEALPVIVNPDQNKLTDSFYKEIIIKNKEYASSIYYLKNIFGKDIGELIIGIPVESFENLKHSNNLLIFQITFLIALAGIILAYILATTITKPLSIVTDAAKAIEDGDFSKRVEVKSSDELGYLAQSFNSMATALEKRKELEQIRDDLAATLTHDLKVPLLASVQTFEHLLKGLYGDLSEKQTFIIEQLISNNKDLLRMVNTILDTYKYEAGKQTLIKNKVDYNKLINECISDIRSLAAEKKHEITFSPQYDKIEIIIDRQEIKRVLINLLSNAITYTHENGKIEISIKVNENEIITSVKDNGMGISETSLKSLFQRYSKGSKTLRKIGTGLGLYLSKHIIEAHNGKIWVDSIKEQGSTFYYSLPVVGEKGQETNE